MSGSKRVRAFAPGRTEIAGNHVDHQGGRVIAATVGQGVEVVLEPAGGHHAHLISEGFGPVDLDVRDADPRPGEEGSSRALVRGMVAQCKAAGVPVGGFSGRVRSTVPSGGGLSSSAAFELAVGAGLARLFADETLDPLQLALMGQAAERDYFGKPCGLMDQAAIAFGGVEAMDFSADEARVEAVDFSFAKAGVAVCLVDVGADHAGLTPLYAQIPLDMRAAAEFFGARRLCDVPEDRFFVGFDRLRAQEGDRVALRAFHYYREMRLVDERLFALRSGDVGAFLRATRASAHSSADYLQNVSVPGGEGQEAMVALALADAWLGESGAVRIHGGGFGGSIQAYVPADGVRGFVSYMDAHLGAGASSVLDLTTQGACVQWE